MKECLTFSPHDLCTLGPVLTWLQLFAMAGRQFGRVTAMAWGTIGFICVKTRTGHGRKSLRSRKSWEMAKWEWGHFLCKEIKVKRKIKVWFPASWFVFCTEIPFFLSEFAETTIVPLPVLVTMTPLTSSLRSAAVLHFDRKQVNLQLNCVWKLKYSWIQTSHHWMKLLWKWQESFYLFFCPVIICSCWRVSYVIVHYKASAVKRSMELIKQNKQYCVWGSCLCKLVLAAGRNQVIAHFRRLSLYILPLFFFFRSHMTSAGICEGLTYVLLKQPILQQYFQFKTPHSEEWWRRRCQ